MVNRQHLRVLPGALATVGVILALFFVPAQPAQPGSNSLALKAPPFLEIARASNDESVSAIASVLDRDAGIAAYAQTSPFTLATIKPLFETIEQETSDYLLGTIAVPNNWENFDVHVYAHKAGWILVYYLRTQPAVMVFDWQNWAGSPGPPTRFQTVVNLITDMLGRSDLALTYYDFRYPNATNMLVAVQHVSTHNTTECFTIQDTSWVYHERSWLHAGYNGASGYYTAESWYELDGVVMSSVKQDNVYVHRYGLFDGTQLPANAEHTVCIHGEGGNTPPAIMGALSLVYGPQP